MTSEAECQSDEPQRTQWQVCDPQSHHLFLLDRLQNFDYTFLIVVYIDAFKDLAVLAPPNFSHNLIVVLISAQEKLWGLALGLTPKQVEKILA